MYTIECPDEEEPLAHSRFLRKLTITGLTALVDDRCQANCAWEVVEVANRTMICAEI
jgi:hypothetical protein